MKGYKAFKKGLVCRGFQFKENEVFEEYSAKICEKGFHFCKNPLDTLDYYDLVYSDGNLTEFAEIEALDEVLTDDDKKYCTKKIKIGSKLDLGDFIKASFEYISESAKKDNPDCKVLKRVKDDSKLASSGNNSKLASSGYNSQLASSGNNSQLASSGYNSKLASSGNDSKLASSGNNSKLASSGNNSQLASSGNNSQLASSGNDSKLASSGNDSKLASSGNNSQLASSGNDSKLASSGNNSQLASSGYNSKLASSGYNSRIELNGKNNVGANISINGLIKGKIGSWITLAEYDKNNVCICVKSAQIDGADLKEDTFYKLKNGNFEEVK